MNRVTKQNATELKCLHNPPQPVKYVLHSTILLLGHTPTEAKSYKFVRKQLTHTQELIDRMRTLDPSTVPLTVALGAGQLTGDLTMDQVRMASDSASRFMEWNEAVIQSVLSRYGEEEIANTKPCTVRDRE